MRRTLAAVVPTKETEQAGAKRLSSSEALLYLTPLEADLVTVALSA